MQVAVCIVVYLFNQSFKTLQGCHISFQGRRWNNVKSQGTVKLQPGYLNSMVMQTRVKRQWACQHGWGNITGPHPYMKGYRKLMTAERGENQSFPGMSPSTGYPTSSVGPKYIHI